MIRSILLATGCLIGSGLFAQGVYQPVDKRSTVQFTIKNLGFNVTGSFSGVAGKVIFDPAEPGNASFDVTVEAASVNTDNSMRDDHLRKESFFDAEHFPKIRLVSDRIAFHRNGAYLFNGQLTIKGHTKASRFPFAAAKVEGGYRFKAAFTVNRRDFGVGGFSTISDDTQVNLDITVN
ncbi:MAG TPA: YceI family protein [Puia sp.]|nr:YceI family protein [Puia sp.]